MFNLEKAIADWRRQLIDSAVLPRDVVDELESHVRENIEVQMSRGLDREAAFMMAAEQIGSPRSLGGEFCKLASSKYRRVAKMFRPACFAVAPFVLVNGLSALWDSESSLIAKAICLSALLAATLYIAALPFFYRLLPTERNPLVAVTLKSMSAVFILWPLFALLDATGIISSHLGNSFGMAGWDLYVICGVTACAYFLRTLDGPHASAPLAGARGLEFSETARAALNVAREESIRFHHGYVGTEHVLLGILATESPLLASLFRQASVTSETARDEVERIVKAGPACEPRRALRYTPRANRSFNFAEKEARAMNHACVSVEHLFLGLLLENEGLAGLVLRNLGFDFERARAQIVKGFDSGGDDGLAPVLA